MVLFMILVIIAIILAIIVLFAVITGGVAFILIFADVIVCIGIIALVCWALTRKKKF